MASILRASGLWKSYGSSFTLGPLDLSLERGEVLAILGPNGAGKSTCLNILAGLMVADAGSLQTTSTGYMREEISIWNDLTCREQVELLSGLYGIRGKGPGEELLATLGLGPWLDRPGAELSMGNRRKLSLVLSVLHSPELLILDEPFNGLDALARRRTVRWIKDWVKKTG